VVVPFVVNVAKIEGIATKIGLMRSLSIRLVWLYVTAALLLGAEGLRATQTDAEIKNAPPKATSKQSATSKAAGPQSKQAEKEKPPTSDEELQEAIDSAGNDRVALVRNLEAFLKKYPEAQQRGRIYRALVEACLQLRDNARASEYAERLVALSPDDMSITVLAIQLLERSGDEAGLRRATSYASRVLEFIKRGSEEKSPKISKEQWEEERNRDRVSVLLLRGRLYLKLHDVAKARADFEVAYVLSPNAEAAEKLGEIAELNKELLRAIQEYARAFALGDGGKGTTVRREVRQKLGNVWRLAHGTDDGLGEYVLRTYDEINAAAAGAHSAAARNSGMKDPFEFTLRRVPDGPPLNLASEKGKVLVVNFWATWCGPCRALEPVFERVAAGFGGEHDVTFLAADCDEDESLVAPYLAEMKPRTTVVFADGLDRAFAVNSFPTVLVIDRGGRIVYRAEGFGEDSFEDALRGAIRGALSGTEVGGVR
jgi:thiol-disulfide isomerase/thioredoxin